MTSTASRAQDSNNGTKLTSEKRKLIPEINKEQVDDMPPDSPKKRKQNDSGNWDSCLQPGESAIPSPEQTQLWEHSVEIKSEATPLDQITDTVVLSLLEVGTAEGSDVTQVLQTRPSLEELPVTFENFEDPPASVDAGIEFVKLEPQSSCWTSSTKFHKSGAKRNKVKPKLTDSGSDNDSDTEPDSSCQRSVFEFPAGLYDNPEDIQLIAAEADNALRAMAEPNDAIFEWNADLNHFQGVRETFTGPSGPTFEVTDLTPFEVFKKFWDDDIIDRIVVETNRYAHEQMNKATTKSSSRLCRWNDTSRDEIWKFLAIIMLQSLVVNNVEREYWFPYNEQLRIGDFKNIISFNRFILLKRCLHFVDNAMLPAHPSKLDKVLPIVEHLNEKFSTLYLPEQNVAIDESLLLWKDRLSFAQIGHKRNRVGIKSNELYDCKTGYLWKMEIFSGKGHKPHEAIVGHEPKESQNATSQIIYNLARPLFGKGHTLIMDSFYNAPLLSRLLKSKFKTDTIGPVRLNREFIPETLKSKNKENMLEGEVNISATKDLSLAVWKDRQTVVAMISTFHTPELGGKEKNGAFKYKPKVVLDYNLSMAGIDHKDQTLQTFPMERGRNMCWYKRLFRRLLNVSIHNASVIYNYGRPRQTQLGNRDFRMRLAQEIQETYCPETLKPHRCNDTNDFKFHLPKSEPEVTLFSSSKRKEVASLSQFHLPVKNKSKQRCKLCSEAKVRRSTMWKCSTCQVNLCIEGCYPAYHAKYVFK